ncbi:hypothetical protein V8C86DRAFT_3172687 [Haematococcus lacustris]
MQWSQLQCFVCLSTNLSIDNGVLLCDDCGTQNQSTPEATAQDVEEQLRQQAVAYLQCLTTLVRAQSEALVARFGVVAEVEGLVRRLWFQLLPHTGFLDYRLGNIPGLFFFTGGVLRTKARTEQQRAAAQQLGVRWQHGWGGGLTAAGKETLRARGDLPLQVTLVVCCVACILLRQPVSPYDLVAWALQGSLPYLDAAARCQAQLAALSPSSAAPLQRLLRAATLSSPGLLLLAVTEVAGLLCLTLPCVNGPLLLLRATRDLALPEEVCLVALELYRLYCQDTPLMALASTSSSCSPYALLLALLALATRLAYGLDGRCQGAPRLPGMPPPPPPEPGLLLSQRSLMPLPCTRAPQYATRAGRLARKAVEQQQEVEDRLAARVAGVQASGWWRWAAARLAERQLLSSFPLAANQARQLRDGPLLAYLRFCETSLAGRGTHDSTQERHRSTPLASQQSAPTTVLTQQLAGVIKDLPNVDVLQACAPRIEQPQQSELPTADEDEGGAHFTAPMPNDEYWSRILRHEPVRNGLGPRPRDLPYNYQPLPPVAAGAEVLHPDLLAVVTACAAYVNVQPEVLYRCMATVERAMFQAERLAAQQAQRTVWGSSSSKVRKAGSGNRRRSWKRRREDVSDDVEVDPDRPNINWEEVEEVEEGEQRSEQDVGGRAGV